MRILTRSLRYALGTVAVGAAMLASTAVAHAQPFAGGYPGTWGQEVKACNLSACYPGGTDRGDYVNSQARDDSGRGYAQEIQDLANPGRALPSPF
ncbi:hypothetical protein GA0111570_10410 [Raineyella antarctica]|uniref:Uncharacterized protein n=1 Tax=Raineyella antarctica TaxID=1577474 RepID=A0A1G6GKJ9_9ACTN|nr:hypothetical protein [Raineyella antarctica]SDB82528.1 hypothetical protein GA0111570_10410 [Raineyella antarctica]